MKLPGKRAVRIGVTLIVAGVGMAAGGCSGHPIQRALEGRWLGASIENVEGPALAAATGWVRGTSLEFAGSTLTVSIPAEEPRSGEFKVLRVHKQDVSLAVTRKSGSVDKLALKLDDDRTMRWMIGAGRAVVMRREY